MGEDFSLSLEMTITVAQTLALAGSARDDKLSQSLSGRKFLKGTYYEAKN
jgi:hypothetical protein